MPLPVVTAAEVLAIVGGSIIGIVYYFKSPGFFSMGMAAYRLLLLSIILILSRNINSLKGGVGLLTSATSKIVFSCFAAIILFNMVLNYYKPPPGKDTSKNNASDEDQTNIYYLYRTVLLLLLSWYAIRMCINLASADGGIRGGAMTLRGAAETTKEAVKKGAETTREALQDIWAQLRELYRTTKDMTYKENVTFYPNQYGLVFHTKE